MKSSIHGTLTEHIWEKGDLVRLKEPGSSILCGFEPAAGEWGRVVDASDEYFVEISLGGYSRPLGSPTARATISRYGLEPWVRLPADEAIIHANVVEILRRLSWMTNIRAAAVSDGLIGVTGDAVDTGAGSCGFGINSLLLEAALPYLGDAMGRSDAPHAVVWTLNGEAYRLLDREGCHHSGLLASAGGDFDLGCARQGLFAICDDGDLLSGSFEADFVLRIMQSEHLDVGLPHVDGRDGIPGLGLPYPRSLRNEPWNDFSVVETDEDGVEVRRGNLIGRAQGAEAQEIRRACRSIYDLSAWFELSPILPANGPAPGFR